MKPVSSLAFGIAHSLAMWDAHDWHGLFWKRRDAWRDGSIRAALFGHALLELALTPGKLLVGKALVFMENANESGDMLCVAPVPSKAGRALTDPLELRPLPLSGIPGWHRDNEMEAFHLDAVCYQPRRVGRSYPAPQ